MQLHVIWVVSVVASVVENRSELRAGELLGTTGSLRRYYDWSRALMGYILGVRQGDDKVMTILLKLDG